MRGDYDEAEDLYKASLRAALPLGDLLETTFEVQGVAMSLAGLGDLEPAEILGAAVHAEMNRLGADVHVPFWDALLEKYLGAASRNLAPQAVESARREGASMPFENAVAMGLEIDVLTKTKLFDAGGQAQSGTAE